MLAKIIRLVFTFLALIFITKGLFELAKNQGVYQVKAKAVDLQTSEYSSQSPQSIYISSLSLKLPIEPTTIKNGRWTISQFGVSFLENSGTVGETGNLIFYGHNWKKILGDLKKIDIDDKISLITDSGREYLYTVTYIAEVDPTDTSILADSKDERITLYTCSGFLDEKRLVVVAKRT